MLQLAEAQLTAIRQARLEDLERLVDERKKIVEALAQLRVPDGERQFVAATLKQAQSIDGEMEACLGAVLEEMRKEMGGIKVGRRLLRRYAEDQHDAMTSTLDVHS